MGARLGSSTRGNPEPPIEPMYSKTSRTGLPARFGQGPQRSCRRPHRHGELEVAAQGQLVAGECQVPSVQIQLPPGTLEASSGGVQLRVLDEECCGIDRDGEGGFVAGAQAQGVGDPRFPILTFRVDDRAGCGNLRRCRQHRRGVPQRWVLDWLRLSSTVLPRTRRVCQELGN